MRHDVERRAPSGPPGGPGEPEPAQLIDVITDAERQIRALTARQVQATARYDTLLRGRAGGDGATAREIALA
ncbi:hypothetical protein, partial [Kineococcus sp. NPDC059986]|uniref:hypothetical protein n=1 Tax=Kineococcus sp. NPDC059986 TaxID=3155538 RepID=UPI0034508820